MALPTPLTTTDKPFTITQIKAYVPIQLDMEKLNYDIWRELFETHCSSFGVSHHIDGTAPPANPDKTWKEHDDLVKMWIYGTISQSILETVLKPKCSARALWSAIENLFRDNKEARALQLENEIRTTVIGDLSVYEYCKKLKSLSDLLANVDSPISDRVLVMHTLNGLSDKFDSIINVIKHKDPFPSFLTTRSMLQSEEDRLSKQIKPVAATPATPSSPTVLYSVPEPQRASQPHTNNSTGNYDGYRGRGGRGRGGRGYRGRGGRHFYNNNWPSFNHQQSWPPSYYGAPPSHHYGPYHSSPYPPYQPGILGSSPAQPRHEAHYTHGPPQSAYVTPQHLLPAQLTHAFNTMTLQDPTARSATWIAAPQAISPRVQINKQKAGVVIGSGIGGFTTIANGVQALLEKGPRSITPFFVPHTITNMSSALLAIDVGFMGPNYSVSTACATSNYCIRSAAQHIRHGEADLMIAGGTEASVLPIGIGCFSACRALSQRNDDPTTASRPWDKDRDGFVLGEGSGVLVMESLEHAMKRGAPILAEYLGGAINCDAYHMTNPRSDGLGVSACIQSCLEDSGVSPEEVNYINAHATSTPLGDLAEINALKQVFKNTKEIKINATKSIIGHCIGAAGAIEAIACLKAINTGWLHPTLNQFNPEPCIDFDTVANVKKQHEINVAISNSFGFGGHNSVIAFSAFRP